MSKIVIETVDDNDGNGKVTIFYGDGTIMKLIGAFDDKYNLIHIGRPTDIPIMKQVSNTLRLLSIRLKSAISTQKQALSR